MRTSLCGFLNVWFLSRCHRWLHCFCAPIRGALYCTSEVRRGGGRDVTRERRWNFAALEVFLCGGHAALDSFLGPAIDHQALLSPYNSCVSLSAVLYLMQSRKTQINPVHGVDLFAKPLGDQGVCAMSVQTSSWKTSRDSSKRTYSTMSAWTPAACSSLGFSCAAASLILASMQTHQFVRCLTMALQTLLIHLYHLNPTTFRHHSRSSKAQHSPGQWFVTCLLPVFHAFYA